MKIVVNYFANNKWWFSWSWLSGSCRLHLWNNSWMKKKLLCTSNGQSYILFMLFLPFRLPSHVPSSVPIKTF
jgi:hypothetical protein